MIEFVEKVNILKSPDGEWYGTWRFGGIPSGEEADRFLKALETTAEELDLELSEKLGLRSTDGGRSWILTATLKKLPSLSRGDEVCEELRGLARGHRLKGQKTLGDAP